MILLDNQVGQFGLQGGESFPNLWIMVAFKSILKRRYGSDGEVLLSGLRDGAGNGSVVRQQEVQILEVVSVEFRLREDAAQERFSVSCVSSGSRATSASPAFGANGWLVVIIFLGVLPRSLKREATLYCKVEQRPNCDGSKVLA